MSSISIIGCGWLGLPFAERLISLGIYVKGSTRSDDKLQLLKNREIDPYKVAIENGKIYGDAAGLFSGSDLILINIPPKLRNGSNNSYLDNLRCLINTIKKAQVEKIVFVSSTSVYKDTPTFEVVSENPFFLSDSERAKTLIAAEQLFLNNKNFNTTIVRFSGLIGPDRHPAKYLAGRTEIKNPLAPINLIHLNDCLNILALLSFSSLKGEIFNAAFPEHPSREVYYSQICKAHNLPAPQFDNEGLNIGKVVSSEKLVSRFKYSFSQGIY